MRKPGWRLTGLLLAAAFLSSCLVEHHMRPVPTDEMLPWLRPGTTSRVELLQVLGNPRRSLEAGRILIWELKEDLYQTYPHSYYHGAELGPRGPYSFVVVVDGERVQRASLVRLWE